MPNYDGRVFVSLENTENGEVDERTRFAYHQTASAYGPIMRAAI